MPWGKQRSQPGAQSPFPTPKPTPGASDGKGPPHWERGRMGGTSMNPPAAPLLRAGAQHHDWNQPPALAENGTRWGGRVRGRDSKGGGPWCGPLCAQLCQGKEAPLLRALPPCRRLPLQEGGVPLPTVHLPALPPLRTSHSRNLYLKLSSHSACTPAQFLSLHFGTIAGRHQSHQPSKITSTECSIFPPKNFPFHHSTFA